MRDNRIVGIIGILFGITICILGFIMLSRVSKYENSAGYLKDTEFGGDFYSYEYKATKVAAENIEIVSKHSELIGIGISYLLLAVGGTDIIYFCSRLTRKPIQNTYINGNDFTKQV